MSDLTGQSFGRYHILAPLGEGGMATVYKAYDTRLEREVALKLIRKDAFPPNMLENILTRFEREAKSLARLSHPNIVPVIDYGDQDGTPYLVMVYLPGGTLKPKLGKPMPWREAAHILVPIAEALEYAHENNLIHRDVKPSNILLTQKGQPMLTDFGIAKILESDGGQTLTGTGVGIGTPEYMAPEQWTGMTSPQSDIYSLGVVLYELVTGRKPYTADTPAAVLLKQANNPLPHPAEFVPDLPPQVGNVILKALAKHPEDRYESMGAFALALQGMSVAGSAEATLVGGEMAKDERTIVTPTPAGEQTTVSPKTASVEKPEARHPAPEIGSQPRKPARWPMWAAGAVLAVLVLAGAAWLIGTLPGRDLPTAAPTTVTASTAIPAPTSRSPEDTPVPTEAAPAITEADCVNADVFCVGLVTDVGTIDDKSFNQTAWSGLLSANKAGNADLVNYIETTDANDYFNNIVYFAESGYDVVVTVGFSLAETTYLAAQKYPVVKFIGIDQTISQDDAHPAWPLANYVSIRYLEDHSGFLVGALAAMVSKTHIIGAVCGYDIPPVWRFCEGFRAGANYADTKMGTKTEVIVLYHTDVGFDRTFNDPEWGAAVATDMLGKGADVIFGCGGKTGNGAVIEAAKQGVFVIGVDTDQYFTIPEAASRMLSSALKIQEEPLVDLIRLTRQGEFPLDGIYYGAAGYAPYHDLADQVPGDVDMEMQAILRGLISGEIKTNVAPEKPGQ